MKSRELKFVVLLLLSSATATLAVAGWVAWVRGFGELSPGALFGMLASSAGLTALLSWVLVQRLVFSPEKSRVRGYAEALKRIQNSERPNEKLAVGGEDELSLMASEVNRLLAVMAASQRALERANAEMQQRVAERTAALAAANQALEKDISERIRAEQERELLRQQLSRAHRMEAVGTLAGGIAHDFNNILTGILGHAQLMAADCYPGDPIEPHVKQVISAAERAVALVRQILAFSRQTPGERRIVSVGQVAREALALLRAALPAGIKIRCTADDGGDYVEADPTQLHQVVMNLGTNAGHALGSRNGILEITVAATALREPRLGLEPGNYVLLEVRDTGTGMSPQVMERIFDPFFSTKPVNQGTGLGLAVVHGIVTDHGGAIDVESKEGEGTAFRIYLPAVARPVGLQDSRLVPSRKGTRGSERVLLVDDEDMVLGVVAKGLQRLGYVVTTESNGVSALEHFEQNPELYDVVITDQTMPQMSGLELTAAIKRLNPKVPVILATGYSPDVADRDPQTMGLTAVINKPVHFADLSEKIRLAVSPRGN